MYAVRFTSRAQPDLRALPAQVVQRDYPRIQALAHEPRPSGAKKLTGEKDIWRIRVGDYRVLYRIEDDVRIVEVSNVGHRKDIYL